MDMSPEIMETIAKSGAFAIAAWFLWRRLESVTDAYLATVKEMAKTVSDNTVATNNYANALNALTQSINSIIGKDRP